MPKGNNGFVIENLSEIDKERLSSLPSEYLETTFEGLVFSQAFKNLNGGAYKGATDVAKLAQTTFDDSRSVNTLRIKASKICKDPELLDKVLTVAEKAFDLDKSIETAQQTTAISSDRRNWRHGVEEVKEVVTLTASLSQNLGRKVFNSFEKGFQRHQQHSARTVMQTMEFTAHIQGQTERETAWRDAYLQATGKPDAINPAIAILQIPNKAIAQINASHQKFEASIEQGLERQKSCFSHLLQGAKDLAHSVSQSTLAQSLQQTAGAISQKAQDDLAMIHAITAPQNINSEGSTNEQTAIEIMVQQATANNER